MKVDFNKLDERIARWMGGVGHPAHEICLGVFFAWLGALKVFGHPTGSSLLAHTVYIGSPEFMVRVLGVWEILIGVLLLWRPTVRLALLLLFLRLPGTLLALLVKIDVCWVSFPFVPTPEGQYLIKDLFLFGAALVIGSSVRGEKHAH